LRDHQGEDACGGEDVAEARGGLLAVAAKDRHHEEAQGDAHVADEGHVGLCLSGEEEEEGAAAQHQRHEEAHAAAPDALAHAIAQDGGDDGDDGDAEADGPLVEAEDLHAEGHHPHQEDGLGEEPGALLLSLGVLPEAAPPGGDPVVALGEHAADLAVVGLPGVPEPEGAQEGDHHRDGDGQDQRAVAPDERLARVQPGQAPERGLGGLGQGCLRVRARALSPSTSPP
jgi:hypothetical protein